MVLAKHIVRTNSLRYHTFRRQVCCANPECSRKIDYCVLQTDYTSHLRRAHVNFFSEDGVLFTKDHILPKSKGGRNTLDNLQTMCIECNNRKVSKYNPP